MADEPSGTTEYSDVARRVLDVLADADGPITAGRIQRRIASDGLDVAKSAVRDACDELLDAGEIEAVGDPPRQEYRLRN